MELLKERMNGMWYPYYADIEELLALGYPPDSPDFYSVFTARFFSGRDVDYTGTLVEWVLHTSTSLMPWVETRRLRLLWTAGAKMNRDWLRIPDIADPIWCEFDLPVLLQADALAAFRTPATLLHTGRWGRIPIELYRLLVVFLIPYVI